MSELPPITGFANQTIEMPTQVATGTVGPLPAKEPDDHDDRRIPVWLTAIMALLTAAGSFLSGVGDLLSGLADLLKRLALPLARARVPGALRVP